MVNDLNLEGLYYGADQGWWDDVDEDARLPILVFHLSDFHDTAIMAHAYVRLGVFDTMKQAKKAGHTQPLKPCTIRSGTRIARIE